MKTTYSKTSWVDNKTAINAVNLNKIESALSDIYSKAIESDQLLSGDGIEITDLNGTKTIKTKSTVQTSSSCTGIEVVTTEPITQESNKLYIVLDSTGKLSKILFNGVTIFNV